MYDTKLQGQQSTLAALAAWGANVEVRFVTPSVPCPRLTSYLIKLDSIKYEDSVFELNATIEVNLYEDEHGWTCEYLPWGIIATGATAEQAVLQSFSESFAVLWDEIGESEDEELTAEAQALKASLRCAVKSVSVLV